MKNRIIFTLLIASLFCLFVAPYKVGAVCNTSINPSDPNAQAALDSCLRQQRAQDQAARDLQAINSTAAQALYQNQINYFYKLDAIEKQVDAKYVSDSSYDPYRLNSGDCTMSMDIPSDPTTMDPNVFLMRMVNKKNCVDYLIKYMGNHPINTQTQQPQQNCTANAQYSNGRCYCNDGYEVSGTTCITYNQSCQNKYGFNSYGDKNNCYCDSGYVWNEQRTNCILVPAKTNDQICSDKFGPNVSWDGTRNSNGGLSCDCKIGYQWDASQTECIVVPPAPVVLAHPVEQNIIPPVINKQPVNNPPPVETAPPIITEQKVGTEPPAPIVEIEQKADFIFGAPTVQINSEPVHKLKWYQKIWNWFMRK